MVKRGKSQRFEDFPSLNRLTRLVARDVIVQCRFESYKSYKELSLTIKRTFKYIRFIILKTSSIYNGSPGHTNENKITGRNYVYINFVLTNVLQSLSTSNEIPGSVKERNKYISKQMSK
jgi:hypothetical protein